MCGIGDGRNDPSIVRIRGELYFASIIMIS